MTWASFGPLIATDATTGERIVNGSGRVYDVEDTAFTTPLTVRFRSGLTATEVRSGVDGYLPEFSVEDRSTIVWRSGDEKHAVINSLRGLEARQSALSDEVGALRSAVQSISTDAISPNPAVWASREFVTTEVAKVSGGGSVDLSPYVKTTDARLLTPQDRAELDALPAPATIMEQAAGVEGRFRGFVTAQPSNLVAGDWWVLLS